MRYCSTWLKSFLCYIKNLFMEELLQECFTVYYRRSKQGNIMIFNCIEILMGLVS